MIDFSAIPVVSYVFFGLAVAVSLVHLVFCFREMELPRKITKGFCTGFLVIALAFYIPKYPLIYVGLALGCLGDIFLLKKHKVWPFALGMISFLVGHILYIAQMMIIAKPDHYAYYVATGVYVVLFTVIMFRFINKICRMKGLALGGTVYFAVLSLDLIWAIICCARGHVDHCILSVFGAICFLASDIILSYTSFVSNRKRRDFYIMSTYILAQMLLTLGLAFTVAAI